MNFLRKLSLKLLLLVCCSGYILNDVRAQVSLADPGLYNNTEDKNADRAIKEALPVEDSNAVCADPDVVPEYPGGNTALLAYLQSNFRYPKKARANNIEGKVLVEFIVTKSGKIENLKIVKELSPECNAEVLRILRSMPDWTPGTKNGMPVNSKYILPVSFRLEYPN